MTELGCPMCKGTGVLTYLSSAERAWGETGKFVSAIKRLRELEPHLTLLEAKVAVEAVMSR